MSRDFVVAAAMLIVSFVWFGHLEGEIRKDYAKAGYMVIGDTAYRIIPAEQCK